MRLRVLTLSALMSASCLGPTSPTSPNYPSFADGFFATAVCRLQAAGVKVGDVTPADFFYIPHSSEGTKDGCGYYFLNGEGVRGHFSMPRAIHYADTCRRVLIHEFGHAILYRQGDSNYGCWEHEEQAGCPMNYLNPPGCSE